MVLLIHTLKIEDITGLIKDTVGILLIYLFFKYFILISHAIHGACTNTQIPCYSLGTQSQTEQVT